MGYYLAQRKRNGRYTPSWMILKNVEFQQYQPVHICTEYTERHKGILAIRLKREKEKVWSKVELNKAYHLIPIKEEEAAEKIFIDT